MKSTKKQSGASSLLIPILKISGITLGVLLVLLIIGLFVSPQPFYTQGFITLADVQRYAASTNELTPLESENAVKPDFTNYYKRFAPSVMRTIKDKLGGLFEKLRLKKPPAFTASFFKTVLEDVNKTRDQKGFKNQNIARVTATPQSKFIVFGDMQAAFHSLVRNVAKLKELGILGDDLKIVSPDCFIIFLGNVPSRSPFSMEIIGLTLRLMQQNPDRVLYTKGSHESDGYWQEHTLKTELKIRAAGLTKDATPLEPEMTKFFDSLPNIIYLAAPAPDNNAFVRFSRVTRAKLPDKHFAKFLMTPSKDPVSVLSWQGNALPTPDASAPEINVKAILRVEKKRETYQPSEGLRTLAPEMGVTTWTLLSAPTLAVERGFKFYNDTFAIIEAAGQIEQWRITLFHQDRRKKDGYKTIPYFLTSGRDTPAPAAPSIAPTTAPQTAVAAAPAPAVPAAPQTPAQPGAPAAQASAQAAPAVSTPVAAPVQAAQKPPVPAPAQQPTAPAVTQASTQAAPSQATQKPATQVPAAQVPESKPTVQPQVEQKSVAPASDSAKASTDRPAVAQVPATTSVAQPVVSTPVQPPAATPAQAPATIQQAVLPVQPAQASVTPQVKQPATTPVQTPAEKPAQAAPVK